MNEQVRWVPFENIECPGCRAMHGMMVRRDLLVEAIEKKKPLKLYCIGSDAVWTIIVHDKPNLKKALDDGLF